MFGFRSLSLPSKRTARLRNVSADEGADRHGITLELSPAVVIASVIGLAVILAWVFVFGVIVGRGYNPETRMPGASFLPPVEPPRQENDIIKAEDLNFMKELKRPALPAPSPPPAAPKPAESAQPPQKAQEKAPGKTVPAPSPAKPPVDKKKEQAKPEPSRPTYEYVFQVCAYRSPEPADATRTRLQAGGIQARTVVGNDTKGRPRWYRVQVVLRGTPADAADLRARLASEGLKDPLLLSRTAVSDTGKRSR